jgi:hypothetical protein
MSEEQNKFEGGNAGTVIYKTEKPILREKLNSMIDLMRFLSSKSKEIFNFRDPNYTSNWSMEYTISDSSALVEFNFIDKKGLKIPQKIKLTDTDFNEFIMLLRKNNLDTGTKYDIDTEFEIRNRKKLEPFKSDLKNSLN